MENSAQNAVESERANCFSVKHAFGLFGLYFGLQMAVGIGIGMVLGMYWGIRHVQDKAAMTPEAIQGFLKPFEPMMALIGAVLSLAICFFYARKWSAEFWKSREGVGWALPRHQQSFARAAMVGAVCGSLVLALTSYFPMSTPIEQTPLGTFVSNGLVGFVIFAVLALVLAPIGEEIVFRGFMLGAMRQRWSVAVSVLVSSFIFGAIHLPQTYTYWPAVLATFTLGFVCAIVRVRTESILAPMLTHFVYNLFPVFGGLQVVLAK